MEIKKKIAVDCTHFIKGRVGGFESYLLNLLDGLLDINELDITLYILSDQIENFKKYSNYSALLIPVNLYNPYVRIAWQNFVLPIYSIKHSVILFPANFRSILLFCKSVTVIHDLQYIHHPKYWSFTKQLYRKLFIPYSILNSSKVIAISNTVKKDINDAFSRGDVDVIYNPITMKQSLRKIDSTEFNFAKGAFFLIPSSLDPHKNIQNLLLAIDELDAQVDSPRFIFVGPYKASDFCLEYQNSKIEIMGYIDVALLNYLYSKCIAVILPSVYEGFGMPYVEALVARKVVIASDIPIARELLGEDAIYIPPPYEKNQILSTLDLFMYEQRHHIDSSHTKALIQNTNPSVVAQKYIALLKSVV